MHSPGRAWVYRFVFFLVLLSAAIANAQTALRFIPMSPCRVVDTRLPDGPFGGPAIGAGTERDFVLPNGACNIPSTAAAYSLNVTVVPHERLGVLTVWPSGQTMPQISTLNSLDARVKADAAIVPAGSEGAVSVYASGTTDVILDINGYFVPAIGQGLAFFPLTPCRVADTRDPVGLLGGPYLQAGIQRNFPILDATSCNIPATAQAYSLNFTVVPRPRLGFLAVWPAGQPRPQSSTLNATTGAVTANAAIVPAGTNGDINVYPNNDTDLVIDIDGYFADPSSGPNPLTLYDLSPCRALDTRETSGAFSGELSVDIVDSFCYVPSNAAAYVLNATVVPNPRLGFLTLWPDGEQQPGVSTLNATDGAITSNMAVVPTQNGWIDAYASASTQLILDISSYFGPITPAITSTSLPSGVLDVFYSAQVYAAGGFPPYTWQVSQGSLPPGLSLGRTTGLISGVPTVQGPSSFTLKITDTQNQTATARLSITIQQAPPLIITTTYLPNGTQGVPYDQTLTATGGVPPYTWTINAGSLPAGLTLRTSGEITGTPTTTGTSNFAVKVTDSESPQQAATANLSITIDPNPVPVLQYMSPAGAPLNGGAVTLQIGGSGFTTASVVQWNGTALATTYQSPNQLTAIVAASDVQALGNNTVTVYNAPPGGGTSAPQTFTVYLALQTNGMVYDSTRQVLWASIPSLAGPMLGNSVVSIDPATGVMGTPIWVGSEPSSLALSSDNNTLWVGLNGAAAVRAVNLTTQTPGLQFTLGGGTGVYDSPNVAVALAVMPGNPNTVAVAYSNPGTWWDGGVAVFDSGIKRPQTSTELLTGLAFSPTGNEIYGVVSNYGSGYWVLTVDSTGITAATDKNQNQNAGDLRYDSGRSYLNNGAVLDAEQGTLLGTFYSSQGQAAYGPIAVDSTIGRAFILGNSFTSPINIGAYDTSTFVLDGTIGLGVVDSNSMSSLVRWGQDGLAFRAENAVYVVRSALVRDLSHTLADIAITASGPASGPTGSNLAYTLTITNHGPNPASPVVLTDNIPAGTVLTSVAFSQGYCNGGYVVTCNLGSMGNNSNATVTISVTALSPGTVQNTAQVSAAQGDPNLANNTAVTSTILSGQTYNPMPALANISPTSVQAGSTAFTLTANGSQFTSTSQILWGSTPLPTTFVSSTQLTAEVSSSLIASQGWTWMTVSNPAPGGGVAVGQPFTVYQAISLDTNYMVFDPFTRKLYGSIPSTAPQIQGNSIVSIDPISGAIGTPVNIGSEPTKMAESDDGLWLYVLLQGSQRLARFNLTTGQADPTTYQLNLPGGGSGAARDLAVLPGADNTLDLDMGSSTGNGIFDISGGVGTFRPQFTGFYSGSDPAFPDVSHLYTYDIDTSGAEFYRWSVGANGLTAIDGSTLFGFGTFSATAFKLNGLAYGTMGGVVNASTTPPQQVGSCQVGSALGQYSTEGVTSAPDPALNRVFYLGGSFGDSDPVVLSFDQTHFTFLGSLGFTGNNAGPNMVRWGQDGLAFEMGLGFDQPPGSGQVMLMHGAFVLPEWGTSNPTPGLVSINPSGAQSGGGNFYLTATGSSFVPGAVLLWNGSGRTTTYQDSQHLKVAIPARDIASPGTATLTVVNPGSAPSGGISFVIH